MRRTFSLFTAAFIFCLLALVLATPARRANAADLQEKCDACVQRVAARYDHCVAVHGLEDVRCGDEFNQGIVNCYRNFCEQ